MIIFCFSKMVSINVNGFPLKNYGFRKPGFRHMVMGFIKGGFHKWLVCVSLLTLNSRSYFSRFKAWKMIVCQIIIFFYQVHLALLYLIWRVNSSIWECGCFTRLFNPMRLRESEHRNRNLHMEQSKKSWHWQSL